MAFTVNLNLAAVAHEYLLSGAPAVPAEIRSILSAFDPSMFTVQSIFLDFQNSDLVNYDAIRSVIPSDDSFVRQNFATALGSWIKGHQGQDNPFILGYPVTRTAPPQQQESMLEPTGANLSTHGYSYPPGSEDRSRGGLSTLNFLLVTGGKRIEDDPFLSAPDAGTFHRNLVEDAAIDGRGIIARDIFLNKCLLGLVIQPFQAALNVLPDYVNARPDRGPRVTVNNKSGTSGPGQRASFVPTPTGWSYTDDVHLVWHESGRPHSHDRESNQTLTFTADVITTTDDSGADRLTVDLAGRIYRYEWDQLNTDALFVNNVYTGKGWAWSQLGWHIQLTFVAGADGRFTITKKSWQDNPASDQGKDGIYILADFFSNLLGLHTIEQDWATNAAGLTNIEKTVADQVANSAQGIVDQAMTRVIMPAPTTFFYKNLGISPDGDIAIDFTYKSTTDPTPPVPPTDVATNSDAPNTSVVVAEAAPDPRVALESRILARAARCALLREPTSDELAAWAGELSPGVMNKRSDGPSATLVRLLMALPEMADLDQATRATRVYDAVFGRYGGDRPHDLDHWLSTVEMGDFIVAGTSKPDLVGFLLEVREASDYQLDPYASPVDPDRGLRVLRDAAGSPLIFTIGTNSQLYLYRHDPARGWRQLPVGCSLPSPQHGHVQALDAVQTAAGAIYIAVAVCPRRGSGASVLYRASGLSNGLDDAGWVEVFSSMSQVAGGPPEAVITDAQFGPIDPSGSSLTMVGAAVQGVTNTYLVEGTVGALWQELRIPEDAHEVLQYAVGRYRVAGVWTLYAVGADHALTFTSLPDRYGKTINISYTELPASATSFALVQGETMSVPDVYVAGDGIVVYRGGHTEPEGVFGAVTGAQLVDVVSTPSGEKVLFHDSSQSLRLVQRTASESWSSPEALFDDAVAVGLVGGEQTAVVVTPGGALGTRRLAALDDAQPLAEEDAFLEIPQQAVWQEVPPSETELRVMVAAAAPLISFEATDTFLPGKVDDYLRRVGLWSNLTSAWQLEPGTLWDAVVGALVPEALASLPRSAGEDPKHQDYVLKVSDEDQDSVRPGQLDVAPMYVHAKFNPIDNCTDLMCWLFYPYNGAGLIKLDTAVTDTIELDLSPLGEHEGDWEHFTIRVDNDTARPSKIYLSAHAGGAWTDVEQIGRDAATGRLQLYASRHGHAMYAVTGDNLSEEHKAGLYELGLINRTGPGPSLNGWETARWQLLSASFVDTHEEPNWLQLPWRWGRTYDYTAQDLADLVPRVVGPQITDVPGADEAVLAITETLIDKRLLGDEGKSSGPEALRFKEIWLGAEL